MGRRRLIWQLFPLFVLVSFGSLIAAGVYATQTLRQFYVQQSSQSLQSRAHLIKELVSDRFQTEDQASLQELCERLGGQSATRVTFVRASGEVIADSHAVPATMVNHATRPEIREALAGRIGLAHRPSETTGNDTSYVAVPVEAGGDVVGVIRVAEPEFNFMRAARSIYWEMAGGLILIAVLTGILSLVAARRITNPIDDLKFGAERFARGELTDRLRVPESQEMGQLADAMNTMARQLEDRIRAVERQRNELEVVFSSMVEGVIAVDTQERVISINSAAASLFEIARERALGRDLREVIRNADLQHFVAGMLRGAGPAEADITLHQQSEQQVRLHGAPLSDANRRNIGCVVVLHDVTALNRLEKARRDFVANVSHELKTPITSIKGYVETLLDGALEDPDSARRFLAIIGKQADRLNALIEDLLKLSRIEQGDRSEVELHEGPLTEILEGAMQACGVPALAKDIRLRLEYPETLWARRNPALLQTAIENLLDNAIKYSPSGTEIVLSAIREGNMIYIRVRDQGRGIERQHLARIFERFYRVDKARSSKLGGTGLGLAIVKHVMRVHGGETAVASSPQKGSTFTVTLPASRATSRDDI